jgi:hypothetical protein
MKELAAIFITLLFGPLMFYLLSKNSKLPRFPVGVIDGYGDIFFLPVFNALAVRYGILSLIFAVPWMTLTAVVLAYIITRIFVTYRKDFAKHNDWSRPKRGSFSAGGWYHTAFMFAQCFFIVISLLHFYRNIWLWAPVGGFAVLIVIRILHIRANEDKL